LAGTIGGEETTGAVSRATTAAPELSSGA